MTRTRMTKEGSAVCGALFLSGCTQGTAFYDTFFVITQPIELLTAYLILLVAFLAAWWVILRLSARPLRRSFIFASVGLGIGLLLASAPTLMLLTGIVWPSVVIIFQVAGVGGGLIGLVVVATAALLIWTLIATLIDRL